MSYTDLISERTIAHQECSWRFGDGIWVNSYDHKRAYIKVQEGDITSTVELPVERAYDFATKLAAWCLARMPQEADEPIKTEPQESGESADDTATLMPEPSDLEVMARELREFYEAYVAAGFTDAQAMHLLGELIRGAGR